MSTKLSNIFLLLLLISTGLNVSYYLDSDTTHDSPQSNVIPATLNTNNPITVSSNNACSCTENSLKTAFVKSPSAKFNQQTDPSDTKKIENEVENINETNRQDELAADNALTTENKDQAEIEHFKAYIAEYNQDKAAAYNEIEYIIKQSRIKGIWDESDLMAIQQYTQFVDAKVMSELVNPLVNDETMDIQVPVEFVTSYTRSENTSSTSDLTAE